MAFGSILLERRIDQINFDQKNQINEEIFGNYYHLGILIEFIVIDIDNW